MSFTYHLDNNGVIVQCKISKNRETENFSYIFKISGTFQNRDFPTLSKIMIKFDKILFIIYLKNLCIKNDCIIITKSFKPICLFFIDYCSLFFIQNVVKQPFSTLIVVDLFKMYRFVVYLSS